MENLEEKYLVAIDYSKWCSNEGWIYNNKYKLWYNNKMAIKITRTDEELFDLYLKENENE